VGFKIKYNSSGVDRTKGNNGIPPNPGIYLMTIKGVKYRKDKNDLEFIVRVKGGDHKGYGFWDYVSLGEASDWKVDQYLQAIGVDTVNKPKGTIDIEQFLNQDVMGRVKAGSWNGEPRPELAAVLPVPADFDEDEEDDDDEDDDEGEDDDEEDDSDDDEEDDDDEDDEDSDDDDEEDDEDDDEDDEDDEPEPPKKSTKKAAAPAAKPAAKKAAAAPAAKKTRKKNYDDMELEDLKAECTKRGLNAKGNKSAIIARLRANDDDPFSE
jgi:SAP domain